MPPAIPIITAGLSLVGAAIAGTLGPAAIIGAGLTAAIGLAPWRLSEPQRRFIVTSIGRRTTVAVE